MRCPERRGQRLVQHAHPAVDLPARHMPQAEIGHSHGGQIQVAQRGRRGGCGLEQSSPFIGVVFDISRHEGDPPDHQVVAASPREVSGARQPASGREDVVQIGQIPQAEVNAHHGRLGWTPLGLVRRERALPVLDRSPRIAQPPTGAGQTPTGICGHLAREHGGVCLPRRPPVTGLSSGRGLDETRHRRHVPILVPPPGA